MSVAHEHGQYQRWPERWTVEDVLRLPEDDYRHELIDGCLLMSPAPEMAHQAASRRLANLLEDAAIEAGFDAEPFEAINVRVGSELLIPDVVVVEGEAANDPDVAVDADDVLLVIEVVSPGNAGRDRMVKPSLYAKAGIPYHWRLELKPEPALVVCELRGGTYAETLTAAAGLVTTIDRPFPVAVDPAELITRRRRR